MSLYKCSFNRLCDFNLQESIFGMILAYIFEKLKQTDKAEGDLC